MEVGHHNHHHRHTGHQDNLLERLHMLHIQVVGHMQVFHKNNFHISLDQVFQMMHLASLRWRRRDRQAVGKMVGGSLHPKMGEGICIDIGFECVRRCVNSKWKTKREKSNSDSRGL